MKFPHIKVFNLKSIELQFQNMGTNSVSNLAFQLCSCSLFLMDNLHAKTIVQQETVLVDEIFRSFPHGEHGTGCDMMLVSTVMPSSYLGKMTFSE